LRGGSLLARGTARFDVLLARGTARFDVLLARGTARFDALLARGTARFDAARLRGLQARVQGSASPRAPYASRLKSGAGFLPQVLKLRRETVDPKDSQREGRSARRTHGSVAEPTRQDLEEDIMSKRRHNQAESVTVWNDLVSGWSEDESENDNSAPGTGVFARRLPRDSYTHETPLLSASWDLHAEDLIEVDLPEDDEQRVHLLPTVRP
jgi:hypothetical protein